MELLPNPDRLRLSLEVSGRVSSLTSATSGPATFVNDSDSMYAAHKPMEVDLQGIHLGETQVEVYNETKLRSVKTDFDGIPLFGQLVNGVARSQQEQKRPELSREVKEKVAAQAKERIDTEAVERLGRVASLLEEKVLAPLDALRLNPTMIAAQTTEERVIARLRLAGRDQLGSCAPRPLAPADSLASVQIDQSAINNVVARLDLDGRTFALPELSRRIARCLCQPEPAASNPDRADVVIRFAAKDAVQVRCVDGRVEVSVSIARFAKDKRGWRDFQVRAVYRPEVNGRSAELVRDGVVQLDGPRLTTGAQIILRGVFSRAFSEEDALEAYAPAAGDRSEAGRPGDHAVCDRRRLDQRRPGRSGRRRSGCPRRGDDAQSRPPSRRAAGPGRPSSPPDLPAAPGGSYANM